MKITKLLTAVLVTVFLCLSAGCTAISTVGDYLKDNPIVASASFRYATATYIDRGKTLEDRNKRAAEVIKTASSANAFIERNPTITVSSVMEYLDSQISWDRLSIADRMLIKDILAIVEADLRVHETSNPLVNVKELLETVIHAAMLYGT